MIKMKWWYFWIEENVVPLLCVSLLAALLLLFIAALLIAFDYIFIGIALAFISVALLVFELFGYSIIHFKIQHNKPVK